LCQLVGHNDRGWGSNPHCEEDAEEGETGGEASARSVEKAGGSCNSDEHMRRDLGEARSVHL
jgi:hypothetical protein